jgi:hypothetical protein
LKPHDLYPAKHQVLNQKQDPFDCKQLGVYKKSCHFVKHGTLRESETRLYMGQQQERGL